MSIRLPCKLGLCLALCLSADLAAAQEAHRLAPPSASRDTPRIGLVLSGGGAKGFAHIGVLKTLEGLDIPVDVVTGTSMGAVLGGLYAGGYSSTALDSIANAQDWTEVFSDAARRRLRPLDQRVSDERTLVSLPLDGGDIRLPTGLIAGQRVSQLFNRLLLPVSHVRDFTALPVAFGAVATDIETGEGVLFTEGYLPRVLRASMAIPSVFAPTKIGNRTYIDGGVARNLPAEDAQALGADLLICSNVGDPLLPADGLSSFVDVLIQAMWYRAAASTQKQLKKCDVTIQPDMQDYGMFSFDSTAAIVERGRRAASSHRADLTALADSVGGREPSPKRPIDRAWRASIREVDVEGVGALLSQRVRALLDISPPARRTAEELTTAIERVYATDLFSQVTYRLAPHEEGGPAATLVVDAERRTQERLRLGLRYSSAYRASILLNASFRDRLGMGGTSEVDLRLGEALRAGLRYTVPVSFQPRLGMTLEAGARRLPIDLFSNDRRTSSVRATVLEGELQFGGTFLNDYAAAIGVTGEGFAIEENVGDGNRFRDDEGLLLGEAMFYVDTFNRANFATSGTQLLLQSSITNDAVLSSRTFSQHLIEGEGRVSLTPHLAGIGTVVLGRSLGDTLPLYRRYYLGGTVSAGRFSDHQFRHLGYAVQELSGRSVQAFGLGVQVAVPEGFFVGARWNTARVAEQWDWAPGTEGFDSGFGFTVGANTLLGPVEVTLMSPRLGGPYAAGIEVGHDF
ncbi:patatin-like phospholipase family protein [Salinibacter ruber]|jgi:NTE family protein|uniref:patatin-like phospholipase family protein n=1 Tax=Salinibacter ruber TaxID=146919 RepID=UPI002167B7BF|nr:patatin-like phospholipase family protein [Salinibacter ruber]